MKTELNSPIVTTKGPRCMAMQTTLVHGPRHLHEQVRGLGRDVPAALHQATSFAYPSVAAARDAFAVHTSPDFNRMLEPDMLSPYGRFGNANTASLEAKLLFSHGLDETSGYTALSFGSGMAAVFAAITTATEPGDEVIFDSDLYGCSGRLAQRLLKNKFARETSIMDFQDTEAFYAQLLASIKPNTTAIYVETETNPHLKLNNIARLAQLCHEVNTAGKRPPERKLRLIVDNTFLGPLFCRPWEIAKDAVPEDPDLVIIVESLTKIISGFGLDIGGAVIAPNSIVYDDNWEEAGMVAHRDIVGGIMSPGVAFEIAERSLPTYIDRSKTAEQVAIRFAQFLETVKGRWVRDVTYPGLESYPQRALAAEMIQDYDGLQSTGFMVGFNFHGDLAAQERAATRYMNFIAGSGFAWNFMVSLGQVRSLTEVPAAMTHYGSGMPMFARNSVGTESPEHIIDEAIAAFEHAYAG